MGSFFAKRSLIAIGHPLSVETQHFAAIADDIHAVSLDGRGGGNTAVGPVEVNVLLALGHNELPEEFAGLFVEAHQDAAVSLMFCIARLAVIGADINPSSRNDGCGMSLGAKLRGPFDVFAGHGIERIGQTLCL